MTTIGYKLTRDAYDEAKQTEKLVLDSGVIEFEKLKLVKQDIWNDLTRDGKTDDLPKHVIYKAYSEILHKMFPVQTQSLREDQSVTSVANPTLSVTGTTSSSPVSSASSSSFDWLVIGGVGVLVLILFYLLVS